MKRTPLKRKTPLRGGTEPMRPKRGVKRVEKPGRKTKLRQRNPERLARLRRKQFGEHADFIRSLPCALRGHDAGICGPSEAAHVRSRGAGGTAKDLVPLCQRHHAEQHSMGILTFQEHYEIDLQAIADDLWRNREGGWAA